VLVNFFTQYSAHKT